MEIIITVSSIAGIAAITWLLNRILPFKICPICTGVAGTWLWMFVGMLTAQLPIANYQLPTAILMGGSIVGIAYQAEKRLPVNRSPFLWKVFFIPLGFAAVYGLISFQFLLFLIAVILVLAIATMFFGQFGKHGTNEENAKVKDLEDKMKNCC